jgi:crotonobetainyl-CoA:carnitine CoA-transferase CaiB-like acyl-CoA transferase
MYISSQSIGAANLGLDYDGTRQGRGNPPNALLNSYRTKDGRWLMLCMLQPDPYWPDFCEHIGRPELITDERFADIDARDRNCPDLVKILDDEFASRTLDEWRDAFETLEGVWAPALSAREIVDDPQVAANGYFPEVLDANGNPVVAPDGTIFRTVTAPIQFKGDTIGALRAMPESGQHTEEILLERGYSWDDIIQLKDAGVTR